MYSPPSAPAVQTMLKYFTAVATRSATTTRRCCCVTYYLSLCGCGCTKKTHALVPARTTTTNTITTVINTVADAAYMGRREGGSLLASHVPRMMYVRAYRFRTTSRQRGIIAVVAAKHYTTGRLVGTHGGSITSRNTQQTAAAAGQVGQADRSHGILLSDAVTK